MAYWACCVSVLYALNASVLSSKMLLFGLEPNSENPARRLQIHGFCQTGGRFDQPISWENSTFDEVHIKDLLVVPVAHVLEDVPKSSGCLLPRAQN